MGPDVNGDPVLTSRVDYIRNLTYSYICFFVLQGLAIRDYWSLGKEDQKDDKYIVLVVDQFGGKGNVLNFNVGDVS